MPWRQHPTQRGRRRKRVRQFRTPGLGQQGTGAGGAISTDLRSIPLASPGVGDAWNDSKPVPRKFSSGIHGSGFFVEDQ